MADDGYRPRPPQDDDLRNAIERLAVFVAKNGPEFEKMTMEKQEGNPKFAFLYGGPFNEYYRFCVEREVQNLHGGPPHHQGNGCIVPPPVDSEFIRRMNIQKEQLKQQITDSERNLKAHLDSIPAMKEAQVAQAVVLSESQKMSQILANVNFNVAPLGTILDQLNSGKCSKDLVSASRKWIFENCQTDQLREVVLTYLLSRVKDSHASDNFRLNILYVINDWAYQCQRKRLDSQTQMLSRYVPQMYAFTAELSTDGMMQQKLDKLIGVWEGHNYFNDHCFKQLRNPGQIFSSAKAVQAAEYAKLAADIEVNLQAMYSGYEQQHKNYVQHIMQQIAQIDMQIEAEKDRARGAIPSLLTGMSREPPPIPCSGPPAGPGLNPRRSRFDQQPNTMASKSQESYGQFFAPPPRSAPKQGWMEDEGVPDGDDIDGHPFNEEDLIPSAKYYELPAGIMLPVIEIEQFSYTALVPDKLRMPPPVPPSQRLLSALDEFYSATLDPTREPPLAAWGRGGCSEFMERKQRLRKILEEKLKSENKSVSDLIENKPSEEELKIQQEDFNTEIKQKYEEMRRNAVNDENEKRKAASPSSPYKRKDQSRSRRSRSSSSSSSSSRSSRSSSSSSTDSSSSRNRSRSRSYSPKRRSRSRSRSLSPSDRPSFGSHHRSPSPTSFGDASRFRMPEMPLSSGNKGAQLMQKMGWSGTGLGASKQGIIEPVSGGEVRDRQDQFRGLGSTMDPYEQYSIVRCSCGESNFDDQIGKFDWRQQYVGCPHEVHFDTWGKGDRLLVSTKEHVFASLSVNTGRIVWRRLQEDAKGLRLPSVADEKTMFTISDSGRVIRAWNKRDGALLWQKPIPIEGNVRYPLSITLFDQIVVVLSSRCLSAFSKLGESLWTVRVRDSEWSGISVNADYVYHLCMVNSILHVEDYSLISGKTGTVRSITTRSTTGENCVIVHNWFVCGHKNSVSWVDISVPMMELREEIFGFTVRGLQILDNDLLLVKGVQSALVFAVTSVGINKRISIEHGVDSAALSSNMLIVISGKDIEVYEMRTSEIVLKNTFPLSEVDVAPVEAAYMSSKNALELLIVGADCRIEFFVIDIAKSSVTSEWVREEALARISAVEMIDLPLSELQQMIEDEFEERGSSDIMSSLIRRLASQASQIHKWFLDTVNQVFSILYVLTTRTNSFSKLLDHVRNAAKLSNRREKIFERDFFNLQKMIVTTSLDGVVFGIDSSDGAIVWRLYLGKDFTPLVSFTGKSEVPLFMQRSTAHYQLPGQASVAFKDANSAGVLVFFNPITGKVIKRTHLPFVISRVDVLSFVGEDHIHPLVVVGQNNEVSLYPPQPKEVLLAAPPVHILLTDSSRISGAVINFLENKITKMWEADLHITSTEKIIEIKGKPMHQKVHSQGRVLIDRNVQYKYVNPNLVSIVSLDSVNQYLSIFLVDVVSGQMIHSARLAKVTAPVHIVHCEHWIAYSYWSEKGRRTEIGILELYEGGERTNKNYFDSLSPMKQPPELVTQSFIYAQGISAMAVSETEQGITTRSLLLALPLGGIHEVTRKLLDATRPLELTQEMREEMIIPYIPEIPIATEDMVNYNQTVHAVRGIRTAASGLESTSLMLAYGIDVFFTRLHPSGTFDILKDDFDHVLISVVLLGLVAGSIVSKKFARNSSLSAAWS